MVLILVDGKSTVAELRNKTGNSDLTTEALRVLEAEGFIARLADPDSIWDEATQLAEEIKASADEYYSQFPPEIRRKQSPSASATRLEEEPSAEPFSMMPEAAPLSMLSMDDFSVSGSNDSHSAKTGKAESKTTDISESVRTKLKPWIEKLKTWREEREIKALRHGIRPVPVGRLLVGGFILAVLSTVIWLMLFFPGDDFLQSAEGALQKASGSNVRIASVHLGGFPDVSLILDDVQFSTASGGEVLLIPRIRLQPTLSSLFSEKPIFRTVTLSGMKLPVASAMHLASALEKGLQPEAGFGIEKLGFESCQLSSGKLQFPTMSGELKRSSAKRFESMLFSTADRSLQIELKPAAGKRVSFVVEGLGWRPSLASKLVLDSLNLRGSADGQQVLIEAMDIRVFDGLVQGSAVFRESSNANMVTMKGDIVFERINAKKLLEALDVPPTLEGETAGKLVLSSSAGSWEGFSALPEVDGTIQVRRGSLRGIDLAEAVRRVSSSPIQGGATQFEQLSSKVKSAPNGLQFSDLVINSGLMQSSGQLTVGKEQQLGGRINLQMRGTANQSRMQVAVSGSLKAPQVQGVR